jgi:hypothetical protein
MFFGFSVSAEKNYYHFTYILSTDFQKYVMERERVRRAKGQAQGPAFTT